MIDLKNKNDDFLELYLPLRERLERFAIVLTGNRDAAMDLTGATVLAAFEAFETLENRRAFLGFLFTIAYRTYGKNRRKLARFEEVDVDLLENLRMDDVSPELRTDINLMMEAINDLDDKYRETLILFHINGFSQKEISGIMGVSVANVKLRLFRGRNMLRKILGISTPGKVPEDENLVSIEI